MGKKRVAIIGTTGLPAKYGGFETLTNHLTQQLSGEYEMTVYCSSRYFAKGAERQSHCNGAKLVYLPFNANGYQSIAYDMVSLVHAIRNSDVLVVLGISGTILLPLLRVLSKKPIIVNIDGQEWKRAKWNWVAKKFLALSEKVAVRFATKIIADNKIIQEYVQEGYGRKDAMLIEYGADHVSPVPATAEAHERYPFLNEKYAIKVCRVEPENNVHIILDAFARNPQHNLVVVGLWSHGNYGRELKSFYERFPNLYLLDPIYDQQEIDMLRSNASLYVHGHSAGGTNPSLVEAMALGLPIISYDVSYNRETTGYQALYFNKANQLSDLLRLNTIDQFAQMGQQMKSIAASRYTWKRISGLYSDAIESRSMSYEVRQLTAQLSYQQSQSIHIHLQEAAETI